MKKFLAIVLTGSMALSFASCSSSESSIPESSEIETTAESEVSSTADSDFDPEFTFKTKDRDGNEYDESIFASNKITMINFWEPWCGPCCNEIPDLETLYETYKGQGFQILGVYSETTMESDVDDIQKSKNVSYPFLHYAEEFDQFQTGYVPTTIFVDSKGHVITIDGEKTVVGSRSYEDWEKIVKPLLG